MQYLKVENDVTGDSWSEDKEWGSWEENNCNSIQGIKLVKENEFYDVVTDFEVKKGDTVYLVYAEYGSGNSFGNSSGNISYVGVYKKKIKAERAVKEIKRSREAYDNSGDYEAKFKTESGKVIKDGFPSWCGYFERLESARIEELKVE